MTDSTSGPNGPQSLAFASLSVQSYHLDSPPFTGTSMGSYGPLAQEGERLAQKDKEKEMEKQRMNHNQSSNPSTPVRGGKKASSPLSRAVKVDEMSRIVDHQDQSQAGEGDSSRLNGDQIAAEGDNGSKPSSSHDAQNGTEDQSQLQSNQGSNDRDVPKWQLDGSTSSTSSSSHSLSSQSQSQPSSTLPSNDNSTDSKLTSTTPIPNSVSRGAPPFSSNGSGESSGISTPISTFKSSSSSSNRNNNGSNSNNSSSRSLPQPSTRQQAYSGGAHSSMESNSHSHAGSTSPPIIDHHQQPNPSQRISNPNSNGNQRKDRSREDSNSSRPSYTQLASQDSSSEHEGDEGEIDRHPPPPLDEEVDGDDTAFVIQHGQNNAGGAGGGGIGGVAAGVGASNSNTAGFGKGVPVQGSTKVNTRV